MYVSNDSKHIELNDQVYEVMPTNDEGMTPDLYFEKTGNYYQEGNDAYYQNYIALNYVESNMSLMNELAVQDYGIINQDGEIEVIVESITTSTYSLFPSKLSDFFPYYKFSWSKTEFTANASVTAILAAIGFFTHITTFKNFKEITKVKYQDVSNAINSAATDIILDGYSYFGNILVNGLTEFVNFILTIIDLHAKTTIWGMIGTILQYVISHFVPGIIKSAILLIEARHESTYTDAEIGWYWSNYTCPSTKIITMK